MKFIVPSSFLDNLKRENSGNVVASADVACKHSIKIRTSLPSSIETDSSIGLSLFSTEEIDLNFLTFTGSIVRRLSVSRKHGLTIKLFVWGKFPAFVSNMKVVIYIYIRLYIYIYIWIYI
jgi:hypothetical protein